MNSVRIAHLTDIHVARGSEVLKDAVLNLGAGLALPAAVVAAIEAAGAKFEGRLSKGAVHALAALGGVLAVPLQGLVDRRLRARLDVVRDLTMLAAGNRTRAEHRQLLYESLHDHDVDHLLVTGDLTTSARREEFVQFGEELHDAGWGGEHVTVLPGNHDRMGYRDAGKFEEYYPPEGRPIAQELIPGVLLVGLDSNQVPEERTKWTDDVWESFRTNMVGRIDAGVVQKVKDALDGVSGAAVLVGLHHPLTPATGENATSLSAVRAVDSAPENADLLEAVLRDHGAFVLAGHHHPKEPFTASTNGLELRVGRASAFPMKKGKERYLSYRVFEVGPRGTFREEVVDVPLA